MNILRLILPLVVLLSVVVFYLRRWWHHRQAGGRPVEQLRREYKQKLGVAGRDGDQIIDDMLRRLKQRYPGRSERWYMEKMLHDLERDRG